MAKRGSLHIKLKNSRQVFGKLNRYIDENFIDLIETLWFELAGQTPRDTGRAQHSWQILGKGQRGKPLPKGQYAGFPNLPAMPAKGQERMRIVNTAPHLVYLNQGWSKQAPALFVQKAIDKVLALYD